MRVLIAEDDAAIAAGVATALRHEGHAVDLVGDGSLAEAALQDTAYDLLVLDLELPQLDGSKLLHRVRRRGGEIAVLVVTARDGLRGCARVLDLGADDYLAKPFALDEFRARVRALLRRSTNRGAPELRLGQLRVDLAGRRAWIGEQALDLTAREFGVLAALVTRAGRLTSRIHLVESLCGWDQELTDNGLDIAVYRLRRKLRGCGTGVRTVRGLGYLLEEEKAGG